MSQRLIGSTGNKARFTILDDDGNPNTDVAHNSPGLGLSVILQNGTKASISLASSGDLLNCGDGIYQTAVPDSAYLSLGDLTFAGVITGGRVIGFPQQVIANPVTAVWGFNLSGSTAGSAGAALAALGDSFTKLFRWFGLIVGKQSDPATLAEINETTGGATYDNVARSLEALGDTLAQTLPSSGPYRLTLSALDDGDLVPGVGLSIVGVSGTYRTTDAAGPVAIDLAAGEYLVRVSVPFGYDSVADVPVELPGPDDDLDLEIALDRLAVTPPGSGNLCRVSLRVADESDVPWVGVSVLAALTSGPAVAATLHANRGEPATTDDDGLVDLDLLRGQAYTLTARRPDGVEVTITRTIPDLANADLSMLLPA